jgi:hypothetical protein
VDEDASPLGTWDVASSMSGIAAGLLRALVRARRLLGFEGPFLKDLAVALAMLGEQVMVQESVDEKQDSMVEQTQQIP